MNAAREEHTGSDAVGMACLKKSHFFPSPDFFETKSRADELPVFLPAPWSEPEPLQEHPSQEACGHTRNSLSFEASSAELIKRRVAWKDWLGRLTSPSRLRPPLSVSERVARIALIAALAPLPIVLAPHREARLAETAPPKLSFENRLSFGQGLGERLKSDAPALNSEPSAAPTKSAQDVAPPDPKGDKEQPTLTELDPQSREIPPIAMDERRWSLPFDSTDYAAENLPTTPDAAFRTGVTVSVITNVPPRVTAENETPPVRARRPSRRAEVRKKGPIKVRVVRLESLPPAVQAAILQQRQAANPSPFPFFLGAPPPTTPPESAPPKKPFSFPESVHDTFKSEY
jgi:hypothetical protein